MDNAGSVRAGSTSSGLALWRARLCRLLLLVAAGLSIAVQSDWNPLPADHYVDVAAEQRLSAAGGAPPAQVVSTASQTCVDVECHRLMPPDYCVVGVRTWQAVTYPRDGEQRCPHRAAEPPLRPPRA